MKISRFEFHVENDCVLYFICMGVSVCVYSEGSQRLFV